MDILTQWAEKYKPTTFFPESAVSVETFPDLVTISGPNNSVAQVILQIEFPKIHKPMIFVWYLFICEFLGPEEEVQVTSWFSRHEFHEVRGGLEH